MEKELSSDIRIDEIIAKMTVPEIVEVIKRLAEEIPVRYMEKD